MDLLLILTYTAFCVAIFKIFRIPLNKWSVPTAVLGGIVLIGLLLLVMNYNYPYTNIGTQVYVTTPIVPGVRGRVTEVDAEPNTLLHKGDILFKIDATPFQSDVDRLEAQLAKAKQSDLQLDSAYAEARSNTERYQAEFDRAKREYERYKKGHASGIFTEQQIDTRLQRYKAAQANLKAAKSKQESARLAMSGEIKGEDTEVANIQAQLEKARFQLEQTVVRAPADGFVTQMALRPGNMAVPLPITPLMTFVNAEKQYYIGAFRQNSLLVLKEGYPAEFVFRAIPGKVFAGKVVSVLPSIPEGQLQAGGRLLGAGAINTHGRIMVKLEISDDLSAYHLPLGSSAEIAVYSGHFHHVAIMRKVLIRMKSWQNYLYLDH